jgi:tetratricopeptide (TPR) repeat protein
MELTEERADQTLAADQHFDRALKLEEADDFENALIECEAAAQLAESFLAQVHNLRGIILEELEREEEAMAAYKKALVLEPGFHEAADNLRYLESESGLGHELVTIARVSHPVEAHVMKGKLASEGIWAFVADEDLIAAYWLYSDAVGGVKLQVSERNVERALEILGIEVEEEFEWEDESEEIEDVQCSECGSFEVRYEKYNMRAVFATWLFLPITLPILKRKWRCRKCGNEWRLSQDTVTPADTF